MEDAGDAGDQHAHAEGRGLEEMTEVRLSDGGGVFGEPLDHERSLYRRSDETGLRMHGHGRLVLAILVLNITYLSNFVSWTS
jgi:hypothetical protein